MQTSDDAGSLSGAGSDKRLDGGSGDDDLSTAPKAIDASKDPSVTKDGESDLAGAFEQMDKVYRERGFMGLADEYGPDLKAKISELYNYASDPKNSDKVTSEVFEALLGVDPTHPDMTQAGLTGLIGGMFSKRARQAKGIAQGAQTLAGRAAKSPGKSTVASRGVNMHNGPIVDRPFEKDYPHGYEADEAGNLTRDIDGRPLEAGRRIVGRRMAGRDDTPLPSREYDAITEAGTGKRVRVLQENDLDGSVGRTSYDTVTSRPTEVLISDEIDNVDDFDKVLGHEVGHVIDQYAGEIPATDLDKPGLRRELSDIFNTLNNPQRDRDDPGVAESFAKPFTPEDMGYAPEEAERELMAEAIRAYMVNPSYIKEHAPRAAAHIRKWVNEHPELRKIVQFNALAGTAAAGSSGDE